MTYARAVLMLMLVVLIVLIVLIVLMLVVLMLIVLMLAFVRFFVFAASKGSACFGQRRRVANDRSKGWRFSGATRS